MLATKNKIEDGRWMIAAESRFAATKSHPLSFILHPGCLLLLLALTIFLSGCGPPGPRALLKGRKYLERGNYSAAVEQFKSATALMSTNAQAWNYLGVAEQHAGHAADAVLAYQRALTLDRDLVEVHYNLGCLWLEQNKPEMARNEFTAYVLRRSKDPRGWAKLGVAQLRSRDLTSAEKSFSTALSIDRENAEALNGLGLAQMQRGHPHDAAQHFAAAARVQPNFGPALLNLATVERQYLHDNALALKNYRAYLALTPHRADWEQVNAIANDLEQEQSGAAKPVPPSRPAVAAAAPHPKPQETPRTQTQSASRVVAPRESRPPPRESRPARVTETRNPPAPTRVENSSVAVETPSRQTNKRPGTLSRMNPLNWFRSRSPKPKAAPTLSANAGSNQTRPAPEPESSSKSPGHSVPSPSAKPFHLVQPAPPSFPRYLYLSPSKPAAGDRRAAGRAFAQAQQFEREKRYPAALDSYREASQVDPSWFEAQYNCGVVAYHLKKYTLALRSYEMALAIRPDAVDARYNFALALQAAGYVPDAVNELKKIIVSHPDNVRAHLALGNLYAQQLSDFAQARAQYLEVLRLDPSNPQAADIQFWLSANPP